MSMSDWVERLQDELATANAEIERLTREVQAWRATFPIMHVREGAVFACVKLPEDER